MKDIISKVVKDDMCVGCGLCKSIFNNEGKIELALNSSGFIRPKLVKKLTKQDNSILRKTCPGWIMHKDHKLRAPNVDSIWGDYYSALIGSSISNDIESKASSGGVLSTILIYLLENKIVDKIIHIGPDKSDPFACTPKLSSSTEEILNNAGSRYLPTSPLSSIHELIVPKLKYAFVGKPCDVAALRQLSLIDNIINTQVIFYFSFFCFGIPSLHQTKKLIASLKINDTEITSLSFRADGWPGKFKVSTKNNEYCVPYKDYMHFLFSDLQLRCKICPDGFGESSDISCGDAWKDFDLKGYPTFNNSRGQNIIFSKTLKGEKLLSEIIAAERIKIITELKDLREIDKIQPGLLGKKKYYKFRRLAFLVLGKRTPKFDRYVYANVNSVLKSSLKEQFKQFLGTLLRILKK